MPQSPEVLGEYHARLATAEQKFVTAGGSPELLEKLRSAVLSHIVRVHEEILMGLNQSRATAESWDAVEYADGQEAAGRFAEEQDVTDPELIEIMSEVGLHLTALRLQLETDDCEATDAIDEEDSYDSNADALAWDFDDLDPDDL